MGVCLSCLGLRKDPDANSSERAALLHEQEHQSRYGAMQQPGLPAAQHSQVDPEQLKRERDALERICAQTSDKLIDVTQSSAMEEFDYASLFKEAFGNDAAFDVDHSTSDPGQPLDTDAWILDVVKNSKDRSWDCSIVHKIDRPLVFNFDNITKQSMNGNAPNHKTSRT